MDIKQRMLEDFEGMVCDLEESAPAKVIGWLEDLIEVAAKYRMEIKPEHGDVLAYKDTLRYVLRDIKGDLVAYSPAGVLCTYSEQAITDSLLRDRYIKLGNLLRGYIPKRPCKVEK